jgi:ankyrin repeat protein
VRRSYRLLLKLSYFISISLLLCSARDYYEPSDLEGEVNETNSKDFIGTQVQFHLGYPLDQKSTETCYGLAAYQLLHYHYQVYDFFYLNSTHAHQRLSLIDVLGQGCGERFLNGGFTYAVLHNVKKKRVHHNFELDLERVFEFGEFVKDLDLQNAKDFRSCCDEVSEILGDLADHQLEDLLKKVPKDTNQFAYRCLMAGVSSDTRCKKKVLTETQLPPYNVHVFEATSELLSKAQKKVPQLTMESLILEEVRHLLQKPVTATVSYPISMAFCPEEEKDGTCTDLHEVVILSARKTCVKNCTLDENWIEEWQISNSYGGNQSGWHKAQPIVESMIKHGTTMTYIRPCQTEEAMGSQSPQCRDFILGAELPPRYELNEYKVLGEFPLHYHIRAGDLESLKSLVESGADLESRDFTGDTPLLVATENDQLEIVKYLIQHGAHREARDARQYTSLVIAVKEDNREIVKYLLENNAEREVLDEYGNTPLLIAIENENFETAKLLLEAGVNREARDQNGDTPLLLAVETQDSKIVRLLLESGADREVRDQNGVTPLLLAAEKGYFRIVKYLVEAGADREARDRKGFTPYFIATMYEHFKIAEYLRKKGAEVDAPNLEGFTPLAFGVNIGSLDTVRYLLSVGANLSARVNETISILELSEHPRETKNQEKIHQLILDYIQLQRDAESHDSPGKRKFHELSS